MPEPGAARRFGPALVLVGALVALVGALVLAGSSPGPAGEAGRSSQAAVATRTSPSPAMASPASMPPSPPGTPQPSRGPHPSAVPPIPDFGHVFVVVMENKGFGSIIGNPAASYINALATRYGLATRYTAVSHPSEPNYLALWSGSTQGVSNDGVYDFTSGTTLGDEVLASGRSWHVAAENVPLGCYRGSTASGGEDGSGTYARKHEPAISWTSVSGNASRCARITDFSHFDPNLGNLWLVVPNLCNDMHDCPVATGDAFLRAWLPTVLDSAAFSSGVVFLTWDEGSDSIGGGGRVATIVISPLGRSSFASAIPHSHYSLLRTIETAWGLPCLANACAANDLREFFR